MATDGFHGITINLAKIVKVVKYTRQIGGAYGLIPRR